MIHKAYQRDVTLQWYKHCAYQSLEVGWHYSSRAVVYPSKGLLDNSFLALLFSMIHILLRKQSPVPLIPVYAHVFHSSFSLSVFADRFTHEY